LEYFKYAPESLSTHIGYISWFLFRTMRSRDHDVFLVRCTINLGYWEFGVGREWGGVEKGEVSLQVTWGQGGWDPITPRRVSK
jgi:hypothetical protein